MAPEVLNNDVYGSKADLWSCGIILYQMLFGTPPYATFNIKELLSQYGTREEVPMPQEKRYLSPVLVEMLRRMLCKDQFRRISWEEFFYEYQFEESGEIKHREKDFEYDLMKLMKRNSSQEGSQRKLEGSNRFAKFDWSKITDMNSSVHSEDCNQETDSRQQRQQQACTFQPMLQVKKSPTLQSSTGACQLSHSFSVGSIPNAH
jgi:serine/threonine protein kinase